MNERAWLNGAMHAGFLLLLTASASRLIARHGLTHVTIGSLAVCAVLAAIYGVGVAAWKPLGRARSVWLGIVLVLWLVLVLVSPSFSWCAVPLYFLCLRLLPMRVTIGVAVVLTAAVIVGEWRIADVDEPSLVLAPIGISAMITVFFWMLDRELNRRQQLIDDLVAARGALAESQHREGVLAERERLAREIHDTLAQGLSSVGMLLQAADRVWDNDDRSARTHVRHAGEVAADNLVEARRFVRDLTPSRLEGHPLPRALTKLCAEHGPGARLLIEGDEQPLPGRVQAVLLRVAQGALANITEHARADAVVITLTYLGDEITMDIHDDGVGLDAGTAPRPGRGFGLRAMRDRLSEVGGTLSVDSEPGEGTTIAARVPLEGQA
ncbi:MAG TPA: sensor histidine kinase [Stackebrandtia sp.]|jgi:signal transduction histidine kinase|uniref:sensor histidine kinase n=1 Tax=Stackebrandtia sp. TaxID=2023065 RepID=UPI002D25061B|nr:sensor histidine kinase [Stackebrandtia sp.]HZE41013.1 sensor histidine kinase [Stackebrandtia sp.]